MFPGPRVRLTAPGNTAERKYGAWIGGSILASLGSFHQVCFVTSLGVWWRDREKGLMCEVVDVDFEKGV